GVQEHRSVGAGCLGNAVALHRLGPGAAVRVVLERVEVARLRARLERDARHLARGAWVVRGELAALLRLRVAAAAGGEDDGRRVELVLPGPRAPAVLPRLELAQRALREDGDAVRFDGFRSEERRVGKGCGARR